MSLPSFAFFCFPFFYFLGRLFIAFENCVESGLEELEKKEK